MTSNQGPPVDLGGQSSSTPDPTIFDVLKTNQSEIYSRCLQLIQAGNNMINECESDGFTLLHKAAMKCQKEIAKLLLDNGANVDPVGGDLKSTPLHLATRRGHLCMVVTLTKNGADVSRRDGEGRAAIQIASHLGFAPIVAYLLANGVHPDTPDRNGMTPLMWAVRGGVESTETINLLLAFGANTTIQDGVKKNTALHWAIKEKNRNAVSLLVRRNASLHIPNARGTTVLRKLQKFAWASSSSGYGWLSSRTAKFYISVSERSTGSWFNKCFHYWRKAAIPYLVLYALWLLFAESTLLRTIIFAAGVYLGFSVGRTIFHEYNHEELMSIHPFIVHVNLAIKFWVFAIWHIYIMKALSDTETYIFTACSTFLVYNFLRTWTGDAGMITASEEERNRVITYLAEEDKLDTKHFCMTCLVRKPLLSSHCDVCNRCIARYDHHCECICNCVGWRNHRFHVGYLFFLVLTCVLFILGALKYVQLECDPGWNLGKYLSCEPGITFTSFLVIYIWLNVLDMLVFQLQNVNIEQFYSKAHSWNSRTNNQ